MRMRAEGYIAGYVHVARLYAIADASADVSQHIIAYLTQSAVVMPALVCHPPHGHDFVGQHQSILPRGGPGSRSNRSAPAHEP